MTKKGVRTLFFVLCRLEACPPTEAAQLVIVILKESNKLDEMDK
jgi:hypothetical protein